MNATKPLGSLAATVSSKVGGRAVTLSPVIFEARWWHPGDMWFLYRLRNSLPGFSKVSLVSHLLWLMMDWPTLCLIAAIDDRRVGYCRVSHQGVVSIAVDRTWRGYRVGVVLLSVAKHLKPRWMKYFVANVRGDNTASQALFKRVGFVAVGPVAPMQRFYWPTIPANKE